MVRFKFYSKNSEQLKTIFDKLKDSRAFLNLAANASVPPLKGLVKNTFAEEKSPTDINWSPLKKPTGKRILQGLDSRYRFIVTNNLVTFSHAKPYAKYHQTGTRYIPARKFLPEKSLPKAWEDKIGSSIKRKIQNHLKSLRNQKENNGEA